MKAAKKVKRKYRLLVYLVKDGDCPHVTSWPGYEEALRAAEVFRELGVEFEVRYPDGQMKSLEHYPAHSITKITIQAIEQDEPCATNSPSLSTAWSPISPANTPPSMNATS